MSIESIVESAEQSVIRIFRDSFGALKAQIAALVNLAESKGAVPINEVRALIQHIESAHSAVAVIEAPVVVEEAAPAVDPAQLSLPLEPVVEPVADAPAAEDHPLS